MRIHTDKLTQDDLRDAARIARVTFADDGDASYWGPMRAHEHGSRKRARAFEVTLRGESRRRPNSGTTGASDDYAATWDQWGVFLAVLFDRDPAMTCWAYDDADAFHAQTADRFRDGWPDDAHGDHAFRYDDGTPGETRCRKCSAVRRWDVASSVTA